MGKASQWDRAAVIALAGAVTIWTACLVVFWTLPFGPGGEALLLGAAAAMLALGLAARLPGWLVRSFHGLQRRLGSGGATMEELATGSVAGASRDDVQGSLRLLAVATVLAAAGGAVSSAIVMLADPWVESLTRTLCWTGLSWRIWQGLLELLGLLPLAIGATLAFLAAAILRAGRGHDAYADVARDWVWGIAAGLMGFALARGLGMNLVGLSMAMGVALLALAGALLIRQDFSRRPGRLVKPVESPTELRRLALETTFAAMALGLAVQLRVLADVFGASLAARAAWLAGSLGLLGWFLGKCDRRGRLPGRRQGAGCQIGLLFGLAVQLIVAIFCGLSPLHLLLLWPLAAAGQIPLAALAATLICRERMLFVQAGGRPRGYLSAAGLGGGTGLLTATVLLAWPAAMLLLPAAAVLAVAAGFVQMVVSVRIRAGLTRWALVGLAVVAALAGMIGLARRDLHRQWGRFAVGRWTTRAGIRLGPEGQLLGRRTRWHSEPVSQQVKRLVGQGRWWIVAFDLGEVHPSLPYYIQPVAGAPDVGAVGPGNWREMLDAGPHRDWITGATIGRGRFDGILVSSIPADHPEAWRAYNLRTLRRAVAQLLLDARSGQVRPLLIRTTVRSGRMGPALALAETFRQAVGSGWMAAQFYDDRADILLAGPVGPHLPAPEPGEGVFVIRLDALLDAVGPVAPIRVFQTPGWLDRGPEIPEVVEMLKRRAVGRR